MRLPVFRLTTAVLAVLVAGFAPRAGAQRIPDRIDDASFWRMVTSFSEQGGDFQSDNFVSNENEWQYVIPGALARGAPGGAYIGVGPEQNFTYIVAFQPRIAFICDIRRQNMIQHLMYKALIEMSKDRAELLSRLWSRPRPPGLDSASTPAALVAAYSVVMPDSVYHAKNLASIFDRLVRQHGFALAPADSTTLRTVFRVFFIAGPDINYSSGSGRINMNTGMVRIITSGDSTRTVMMSQPASSLYATFASLMQEDDGAGVNRGWLGSETAFRALKEFQTRNLLVPIVGNFVGDKALRAIGNYLQANDSRISVFYASNVEQYLFQQYDNWGKFYANVATMPTDSNSIFIRSLSNRNWVPPKKPGSRMAQMTSSIDETITAYKNGRIAGYLDLFEMLRR